MTFKWWYKNRPYTLDLTLYESVYEYYAGKPGSVSYFKSEGPPADWKKEFYGMFTEVPREEEIFALTAEKIREAGKKRGLTDDEIVELAITFVQAIPYDRERALRILREEETSKYPYEVLYRGQGTCSGKSFLGALILDELGYGRSLFAYEERQHLALAVRVPRDYSNYSSGYGYVETTVFGLPVGIVPEFESGEGAIPVRNYGFSARDIRYIEEGEGMFPQISTEKMGEVSIYQKTEGKVYNGIKQVMDIRDRIIHFYDTAVINKSRLKRMKVDLNRREKEISRLIQKMEKEKEPGNINRYNRMVENYRKEYEKYKNELDRYNNLVDEYNGKIEKYNLLIAKFYSLEDRSRVRN